MFIDINALNIWNQSLQTVLFWQKNSWKKFGLVNGISNYMISNGYRTVWSTIQGVIGQVILNQLRASHKAAMK